MLYSTSFRLGTYSTAIKIFANFGMEIIAKEQIYIFYRVIDLKTLSIEDDDDVKKRIQETLKFLWKMEKEAKTNFSWPTPETFRGLEADEEPVLSLVKPLILGGKGGIKPARY